MKAMGIPFICSVQMIKYPMAVPINISISSSHNAALV